VLLCFSQLTTLKFPHIIRVAAFRYLTLPLGVLYVGNLFYLSWSYSNVTGIHHNQISELLMAIFPAYIAAISIWRTSKPDAESELLDS
jgi:phosphatidylcholine synthase